jgi:hypothetical protein
VFPVGSEGGVDSDASSNSKSGIKKSEAVAKKTSKSALAIEYIIFVTCMQSASRAMSVIQLNPQRSLQQKSVSC